MHIQRLSRQMVAVLGLTWAVVSTSLGAQVWVTGVLEEMPGKYSRCAAISEDGKWVVGTSLKTNALNDPVNYAFSWSKTTGLAPMTTSSSGDSYATGCATTVDGTLLACGNIGGMARKWQDGAWWVLPTNPAQTDGNARSVYALSYNLSTEEYFIVGSSFPAENEKAYRYKSNNSYTDYWGYYQDAYGVARNGWAIGKNNWGNGQTNPEWRYDHAIFIFDWAHNGAAGYDYGWDQIKRFSGYGDTNFFKSRGTAINSDATWAVGYMTYNPADLSLYHAFKWQVPAAPALAVEPGLNWPRPLDLGVLGAGDTTSYAYCVSNGSTNGIVIGGTSYGTFRYGGYKAVFWDNSGCHDLYTTLQGNGVDMSRWASLNRVTGISSDGTMLVGYGLYDDDANPGTAAVEMGFFIDLVRYDPQPPTITQNPRTQQQCYGSNVTFTVGATGEGSLTYRWQKNQVDLANGGHYSGVTTSILQITAADSSDLANYRCVVTNAVGSTNSSEGTLTLTSSTPPAPVSGVPTTSATDKIAWKWTTVTGASGYRVKDAAGVAKSSDLPSTYIQWQETGLSANTLYQRFIYAFNACGDSAPSAGQLRCTLALPATYGSSTTNPTVTCDKGFSVAGLAANAAVTFTAPNGFGEGANRVGQFGYLWNQSASDPSSWSGEQIWSSGTLVKQVGATNGDWYLHIRSYNSDTPKVVSSAVFNLGPYTVGPPPLPTCLRNPGFENGFSSGVGVNWTKYNYTGTVTCADSTTQYYSGAHSQAITSASSANEGGVYQQFTTTPGQSYTVRAWFKCSNTSTEAYLGVDPLGGTSASSSNVNWNTDSSTAWKQINWTGTAQAGKITVFLDVWSTNSNSGTVYFDDVEPGCSASPDTPLDAAPQALSPVSIRWKWTDVGTETGYRVIAPDNTVLSGDLPADTTQWDETTGLVGNTQYTRRIVAFNASGASGPSVGRSCYSLIETPTSVLFSNVTAASIDASPSGTLSNLGSGSSGARVTNKTTGTSAPWQASQNPATFNGLTANTSYTFAARARNGESIETADSPDASIWTLSAPVTAESITADKNGACVSGNVTWTAVGGFGAGKVQYYRYAWDQNATYTFTGSEPAWSSGTLTTVASSAGTWYLHVRGYNGADVGNGTFDYPVVARTPVVADFDGDCDVDSTDAAIFIACNSGPGVLYNPDALPTGCTLTPVSGHIAPDFDSDGDVDQSDFGMFQRCITGADGMAAPGCGS